MELEVIYNYNGRKSTYYVTIDTHPNLLQKDIESSIIYQLKKHDGYCHATDSLEIESIRKRK